MSICRGWCRYFGTDVNISGLVEVLLTHGSQIIWDLMFDEGKIKYAI